MTGENKVVALLFAVIGLIVVTAIVTEYHLSMARLKACAKVNGRMDIQGNCWTGGK